MVKLSSEGWPSSPPPSPPPSSVRLEWSNLSYTVRKTAFNWRKLRRADETITILNDVSGSARSGQLIAIMGPSGAGKTSLLATISHRLRCSNSARSRVSGHITVDGHIVSGRELIGRSAFVSQFDIAPVGLTAREHLQFMCQLRGVQLERIEPILGAVGLRRAADTMVAVMSGGERKKLNLAAELLTDPSIIFCDEPTTGLDSYSALSVVQTLRNLADNSTPNGCTTEIARSNPMRALTNKTVLCSIHQPPSDVFECFTHVILMRSGSIVFQGTVREALRTFASMGHECPRAFNPAEFLVKTISDKSFAEIKTEVAIEHRPPKCWPTSAKRSNACWISQVLILLRRSTIESRRSMKEFIYKLTTFVLTAIFIGALYMDVDYSGQKSIQDISGFVFNVTCEIIFATAYNVVYYYPSQMPVLRRETGEQIYSLSAFYVANLLGGIPRSLIECFVFLGIIYPFVGIIRGVGMFAVIGVTLTLVAIPSTAYGLMLSGMFESITVATAMAPPFDVILCLAAGVYVRLKQLWFLKYFSPFFYANEALMVVFWKPIAELGCYDVNSDNGAYCLTNGDEVLTSMDYGTTYATLWLDFAGLIGCALAMSVIGFWGVRRMVNRTGFY